MWAQFRDAVVQRFELVTEVEEAHKQLRALRQTGRVASYVQKFQEVQYRLPGMTDEDAFHAFISGLQPHLQEHFGAQCHNCGGDHFLRDCKEWKEIKEKLRSSLGKE